MEISPLFQLINSFAYEIYIISDDSIFVFCDAAGESLRFTTLSVWESQRLIQSCRTCTYISVRLPEPIKFIDWTNSDNSAETIVLRRIGYGEYARTSQI